VDLKSAANTERNRFPVLGSCFVVACPLSARSVAPLRGWPVAGGVEGQAGGCCAFGAALQRGNQSGQLGQEAWPLGPRPPRAMKHQRISQLTAEQVQAAFSSDRFLELTDDQLVALHHRSEQLQAQQHQGRVRRRRNRLMAAASVAVLIVAIPMWQAVLAVTVSALLWCLAIAMLRDASRALSASVGRTTR
jgi:hypothetical protein